MNMAAIKNQLKILSEDIDKFISKKKSILNPDFDKIITYYKQLKLDLIKTDNLDENVFKFISENTDDVVLPKEYLELKSINKLIKYANSSAQKKINLYLKEDNYKKALPYLTKALKISLQNSKLIYPFEKYYKKYHFNSELIELYKVVFYYTYDPKSCEKIGDIYVKQKEYEKALDYYLNVAELSENNFKIYLKLAKIFKNLNDEVSYNACIQQADRIKAGNG